MSSRLLNLAPELRNKIYEYALTLSHQRTEKIDLNHSYLVSNPQFREPGLLTTCHQIRREALQIYLLSNHFAITVFDCQIDQLVAFERRCEQLEVAGQMCVSVVLAPMREDVINWEGLWRWALYVHAGTRWLPGEAGGGGGACSAFVRPQRVTAAVFTVLRIAWMMQDATVERAKDALRAHLYSSYRMLCAERGPAGWLEQKKVFV
jgi:hypothetical protein